MSRQLNKASAGVIKVLLIGPLPPPMGGNTRHFSTLIEDLDSHERFSVKLINTSRGQKYSNRLRNLAAAATSVLALISNIRGADIVSYHASDRGMFLFGPFVVALSKLAKRPTVLRMFGGSFGDFYHSRNRLIRTIIRKFVLSSDVVLLQTRRAVHQLQEHAAGKLVWFSTYIKSSTQEHPDRRSESKSQNSSCTRFVFLGHLWRTKGLETMLEAAPRLPQGTTIDIYGPLDEYGEEEIQARGMGRVNYCGFLTHAQVDEKLWDYDCLVLPTFHPNEGYPGVIAEAFAHALPVITTRWLAIPEIVDDDCGILIEPGNTEAFVAAVAALYFNRARWLKLRKGARIRALEFDHSTWSKRFEEICEQLLPQ